MRRLVVFNNVTLDGFFAGPDGDFSWAHQGSSDAEWQAFVAGNAEGGGCLVLGRRTYELMASYWPTPLALQQDSQVAAGMNRLPKVVFSHTMQQAAWEHTTLVQGDAAMVIRTLKQAPGPDMTILGSGTLVAQLAPTGLIDEYQLVVNPVVLGAGRTLFEGLAAPLPLQLARARTFANGKVLLCYASP